MPLFIMNVLYLLVALFFAGCSNRKQAENNSDAPESALVLISEKTLSISEPSGLAYNQKTKTLYTVSDGNSTIYEITLGGVLVRSLVVSNYDLEGITFSKNFDSLYIASESSFQVVGYNLAGAYCSSFKIITSDNTKHGFEGVTKNQHDNFVIINEKLPTLVVEANNAGQELMRKELTYTTDISDICYDPVDNCYWVLSDESKKVLKLRTDFGLISSWSIQAAQPEGIAIVDDTIYIVSDSDSKMQVYKKPG